MSLPDKEKIHCSSCSSQFSGNCLQIVFLKKSLAISRKFQEPRKPIGKFMIQFTILNAREFLVQFFRDEQGFGKVAPPGFSR